jgi:hypothetical protein
MENYGGYALVFFSVIKRFVFEFLFNILCYYF